MNVLILGGSGFLSGTLARCAVREGHGVTVITRGSKPIPNGVASIVADRKDRDEFARVVAKTKQSWDLVIDCIGYEKQDAQQCVDVFTGWARHFIFISSDFVLTTVDRPWKVDETFSKFGDTPYSIGKRAAEEVLLQRAGETDEMRITILRPCHIYGPGSLLGCLPKHGRDAMLLDRMKRGEPISLLGGGYFLQQPIYAEDLWSTASSCLGNPHAHGQIYFTPGPQTIQSLDFYTTIAEIIGCRIAIEEVPITAYLEANPGHRSFCAHRVYDMSKAINDGLKLPTTGVATGLAAHIKYLQSFEKQQIFQF